LTIENIVDRFFFETTAEFQERLGLPKGFFDGLLKESDWAFVIKLHASLESCLTRAICAKLGRPELEDIFARLETSNESTGKIAFAKRLGLLDRRMQKFVRTLSEIRNKIVHDPHNTAFDFQNYWDSLEPAEHARVCFALALEDANESHSRDLNQTPLSAFVNDIPKFGIGLAMTVVMTSLYTHAQSGDLDVTLRELGEKMLGTSSERIYQSTQDEI
jgi:hypothetical protein